MDRIEVPQPRFATAMAIGSCVLLLPLALLFMGLPPSPGTVPFGSLVTHLAIRALVVVLLGYLLVIAILEWRDNRPLLAVDADGIYSRRIRPTPLLWSDVSGARRVRVDAVPDTVQSDLLCIRLSDPSTLSAVMDPRSGLLGWLARQRRIPGSEIQLDLTSSDAEVADLVKLINANSGRRGGSRRAR